jgi:hypothetical protein
MPVEYIASFSSAKSLGSNLDLRLQDPTELAEAPFLFQFLSVASAEIRRNAAVNDVEDEDRFLLLALRRMDRGQDQIVLIK